MPGFPGKASTKVPTDISGGKTKVPGPQMPGSGESMKNVFDTGRTAAVSSAWKTPQSTPKARTPNKS